MPSATSTTGLAEGRVLLALGAAPFLAGVASNAVGLGREGAPRLICPFAASTGLPCPFCGASRAFRLVTSGDPTFLQYNPFWVAVATVLLLAGVALLVRERLRSRHPDRSAPRAPTGFRMTTRASLGVLGVMMLGGWCVALANRDAIVV